MLLVYLLESNSSVYCIGQDISGPSTSLQTLNVKSIFMTMMCLCLFHHFIVALIEWNIHLLWVWAMLGSTALMKTLEVWDMHFHHLKHFCVCVCVCFCVFLPHLHSDQVAFNGKNHQKHQLNIQLGQSYQQIDGPPPENGSSMRRIYAFWSCVHITSMFWCTSIINNVLN